MPDLVTLAAPGMSITLDLALGGRATSWLVDGCEILGAESSEPVENGMYPMAPWAGRVRDNTLRHGGGTHLLPASYGEWALHGTVLAAPSVLLSCTSTDEGAEASIVTDLGHESAQLAVLRRLMGGRLRLGEGETRGPSVQRPCETPRRAY